MGLNNNNTNYSHIMILFLCPLLSHLFEPITNLPQIPSTPVGIIPLDLYGGYIRVMSLRCT